MGIWSSICSVASSVSSAISSAVSGIGSALSSFASSVAPVIGPILSRIPPIFGPVSIWANTIGQVLNLFKPDEKVEDVGDHAIQAGEQGVKPENFENFDQYMDELRKFPLDPEKSKQTSSVTKLVAGMGVATLGMEDKFGLERGSMNEVWLLPLANSEYFTPERVKTLLEGGKTIGDVSAYLEKRMSGENATRFEKNLETPNMSKEELGKLYDAMDSARENWADLEQKLHESKDNE